MGQILMRVMVSLNLADIMTATGPATPQPVSETPNNEADSIDPSEESQLSTDSEPMTYPTELIE